MKLSLLKQNFGIWSNEMTNFCQDESEMSASGRRRSCKSELRLNNDDQMNRTLSSELELVSRSRSQQNFKKTGSDTDRFGSINSMLDEHTESMFSSKQSGLPGKTLSSKQISEIGSILEKTKQEINRKLNDLKASAIKVQLEGKETLSLS